MWLSRRWTTTDHHKQTQSSCTQDYILQLKLFLNVRAVWLGAVYAADLFYPLGGV
jgi:hypothetical protein